MKKIKSLKNLNINELFNDNINPLSLSLHINFYEIKKI